MGEGNQAFITPNSLSGSWSTRLSAITHISKPNLSAPYSPSAHVPGEPERQHGASQNSPKDQDAPEGPPVVSRQGVGSLLEKKNRKD